MSKIRDFRTAKGLSQEQFAAALGVRKGTISRIENGRRTPSVGLVSRICEFAKGELTADDVIGTSSAPTAPEAADQEPEQVQS